MQTAGFKQKVLLKMVHYNKFPTFLVELLLLLYKVT